ncbi:Uncharacterised protein [Bordetella pertussis]|nr:Uncharacterised protein [Bordetella pertussis]
MGPAGTPAAVADREHLVGHQVLVCVAGAAPCRKSCN